MFSLINSFLGKRARTPSPPNDEELSADDSEEQSPQSNQYVETLIAAPERDPEYEDFEGETEWITLAQRLAQIVPDADIRCPNVIIVG
jgi:hypothetical protein